MKKLPIGLQNFEELRTENYYYVDKTPFIKQLVEGGKYYFLSRPRRFGKSLFLNTLKHAFSGSKTLFDGLYLENNWDWNVKHPVIHISFGSGVIEDEKYLERRIQQILKDNAENLNLTFKEEYDNRYFFIQLIREACRKYGQKAVVLVDEYDKPILDSLTQKEKAVKMRGKTLRIHRKRTP
jgi:hypothetical protein